MGVSACLCLVLSVCIHVCVCLCTVYTCECVCLCMHVHMLYALRCRAEKLFVVSNMLMFRVLAAASTCRAKLK